MISIVWMVFTGWFLSLFNMHNLVINGMSQLFGIKIGMSGYYFIFILLGMAKVLIHALSMHSSLTKVESSLEELVKKL